MPSLQGFEDFGVVDNSLASSERKFFERWHVRKLRFVTNHSIAGRRTICVSLQRVGLLIVHRERNAHDVGKIGSEALVKRSQLLFNRRRIRACVHGFEHTPERGASRQ